MEILSEVVPQIFCLKLNIFDCELDLDGLDNLEEDTWEGMDLGQNFETTLSDGETVELVSNGKCKVVTLANRKEFSRLVRKARMTENVDQVYVIKERVRMSSIVGIGGPGKTFPFFFSPIFLLYKIGSYFSQLMLLLILWPFS